MRVEKDGEIRGGKINQLRTFGDYLEKREQEGVNVVELSKNSGKIQRQRIGKASIEELKILLDWAKPRLAVCEPVEPPKDTPWLIFVTSVASTENPDELKDTGT